MEESSAMERRRDGEERRIVRIGWGSGIAKSGEYFIDSRHLRGEAGNVAARSK
jgi:hypothetical protein